MAHPFTDRLLPHLDALVRRAARSADGRTPGLLVALSGGPDSVALLRAARMWADQRGAVLEAAHLNHRLRGADADADEAFCRELCDRLAVPLHVRGADARALARRRGRGLEEAGRRLRRVMLRRLLDQHPALDCVATGHHRGDQVETIVMRLFRGAGPGGVRGMLPVSGRFIHPLLPFSREQITGFLDSLGQPYRLDATNETGQAARSRVRLELLPLARDIFGAGAEAGPLRLAALLAGDAALLDRMARRAGRRLEGADGTLDAAGLAALPAPLARRAARRWLAGRAGLGPRLALAHVEAMLAWLPGATSGGGLDLPAGWRLVLEFGRLRLLPPSAGNRLPLNVTFRILSGECAGADEGWRLTLPAAALRGEPRLRAWRDGDRLRPLGLGGGKKVSDLLREHRVPRSRRAATPVVEDDGGILWVVGVARDERTRWLPGDGPAVTLQVLAAGHRPDPPAVP